MTEASEDSTANCTEMSLPHFTYQVRPFRYESNDLNPVELHNVYMPQPTGVNEFFNSVNAISELVFNVIKVNDERTRELKEKLDIIIGKMSNHEEDNELSHKTFFEQMVQTTDLLKDVVTETAKGRSEGSNIGTSVSALTGIMGNKMEALDNLTNMVKEHVEPNIEKGKQIYKEHVEPNFEKGMSIYKDQVKPLYEKMKSKKQQIESFYTKAKRWLRNFIIANAATAVIASGGFAIGKYTNVIGGNSTNYTYGI